MDLLGLATSQCFLATLGDSLQLQAGTYQQIRVILASNSASLPSSITNACKTASANNCVVLSDGSVHALNLSSEAQTGIKIPGSQIASGGFTIAGGQTKDLDIDFNTCASIVKEGNGQYRLKPVLHAGEVSTTSNSINGTVLDAATGMPVNGKVNFALEQKDSGGIDRIVMSGVVAADGTFVICPVLLGNTSLPYDVVIVGTTTGGALYQPSIITGVSVGSTTGNIKLYLPTTSTTPTLTNSSAALSGVVTSQNTAATPVGTVADVQLSTLETVNAVVYTIPLPPTTAQNTSTLTVTTAAAVSPATCPPGAGMPAGTTDCVNYTLSVPSGAAYWGAWSSSGTTLTAPPVSALLANYSVDGIATVPGSGGTLDCSPSEIKNPTTPTALATTVPYAVTGLNLNFAGCQ